MILILILFFWTRAKIYFIELPDYAMQRLIDDSDLKKNDDVDQGQASKKLKIELTKNEIDLIMKESKDDKEFE